MGHRLPHVFSDPLFGRRAEFGPIPREDDSSWLEWQDVYLRFYEENQRRSIGRIVTDAGYRALRAVDLTGKTVLEVGAGALAHMSEWCGRPGRYILVDVEERMLELAASRLRAAGIPVDPRLTDRAAAAWLPVGDSEVDVVLSFYSLEHLYPLDRHLMEIVRVLRPGGRLVGAIPAEGGLAWGLGRYVTSRRWLLRNTGIDPDKIICWEHPNFADSILKDLGEVLMRKRVWFWPLRIPLLDANLVVGLEYRKPV